MEFLKLPEAIARYVRDGDQLALEGFTHLIPFAAGHEIIRQGRRDLTLIRMTPDLLYDQMIGMGMARKLVFSWGGNPGLARCTACATRWNGAGPGRSNWSSTAMRPWPMATTREPRGCRAPSSAGTRDRIWLK